MLSQILVEMIFGAVVPVSLPEASLQLLIDMRVKVYLSLQHHHLPGVQMAREYQVLPQYPAICNLGQKEILFWTIQLYQFFSRTIQLTPHRLNSLCKNDKSKSVLCATNTVPSRRFRTSSAISSNDGAFLTSSSEIFVSCRIKRWNFLAGVYKPNILFTDFSISNKYNRNLNDSIPFSRRMARCFQINNRISFCFHTIINFLLLNTTEIIPYSAL